MSQPPEQSPPREPAPAADRVRTPSPPPIEAHPDVTANPSKPPPPPAINTALPTPSDAHSRLSPSATDRVYPIRSVVAAESALTPSRSSGGDYFHPYSRANDSRVTGADSRRASQSSTTSRSSQTWQRTNNNQRSTFASMDFPQMGEKDTKKEGAPAPPQSEPSRTIPPRLPAQLFSDIGSTRSCDSVEDEKTPARSASPGGQPSIVSMESQGNSLVTHRFKHVVTEGGHMVITGRDETPQRCEDEPIHIPGAIQGFGLLVALQEDPGGSGSLTVRVVSENSKRIIGRSPRDLFALESFTDILSEEQADNLLDHIDFIKDEDADVTTNGPEVFTLSIKIPKERSRKLWCAMHISDMNPGLIICEFELEDDKLYPLVPPDELTPDMPEDTLSSNPTKEEFLESTEVRSRPLRVLRSARKRKGEAAAMEVFNIMSQVQEQLADAPNLDSFLNVLVGVVKELTGFHRVMVYQFDHTFNGRVVTELVDPRATKDLYKGLHFPASDIPKQARELYKLNRVRMLYNRELETARLICRTAEDLAHPLDLTHSYLRAMSPIHLKYLANMAVRSSMSISINAFGELWGLISCHGYGLRGTRVSFPIRKMCRLVGDSASRNIERLSYASRLQARKLINTVSSTQNPSGYIVASSDDLLKLFDADFGLLSIQDETKVLGQLEQSQEALAILEYLRMRKVLSVTTSLDIQEDFPDLRYPPGFQVIAGMLVVPLSSSGSDFIVFFRKGQLKEVKWAGNPYEKFKRSSPDGYLEPRSSFKIWRETVVGKCREWAEEEVETAAVLCLVYGKFIQVWRQKEAALESSQLTRLLLANSAHEVRTPLNAIINYLEIALEGSLDTETRENLSRSHSASKSLIYVINDLLDLTKAEEGGSLIKGEIIDLSQTIKEATDMFRGDARRKNITYEVIEHPGLPESVIGDQRKIRQAISNITANAIQNTTTGGVKVEVYVASLSPENGHIDLEFAVTDTGVGMSAKSLDQLFNDLEQVQEEPLNSVEDALVSDPKAINAKGEKTVLGLGLAVVARIVRNMNGQLRLKSDEGQGSRFVIQLPFDLPDSEIEKQASIKTAEGSITSQLEGPEGERTSERGSSVWSTRPTLTKRHSADRSLSIPPQRTRSKSVELNDKQVLPPHQRSMMQVVPGQEHVVDSGIPVRAVKIPDVGSPIMASHQPTGIQGEVIDEPESAQDAPPSTEHMSVLVAEDDPVNSKIIKKRLEKLGHIVHLTVNGEECSSWFGDKPSGYDVILMDMQMPIVDGLTSTKMIRSFEKAHPGKLSPRAARCGRIPIIAVSASLLERSRQMYIDAGFDAWILKPISFARLNELMNAIVDPLVREDCLYQPGQWEKGGWFHNMKKSPGEANAGPPSQVPTSDPSEKVVDGAKAESALEKREHLGIKTEKERLAGSKNERIQLIDDQEKHMGPADGETETGSAEPPPTSS
ncbi:hypothetical protein P154DRAFT_445573 [Amniculicola lignicola CBS 123094]|uniref:Cyanobacterial phytochrome B n=1 Tax=Amniculicola lignicola CBS 123094 TaxID=1392246 RepID=A0A6A5W375_9PLEO|nr:hypothetical protein P154DRAFT_445573 [Amniculicola lignicola CBS 123094]